MRWKEGKIDRRGIRERENNMDGRKENGCKSVMLQQKAVKSKRKRM